MASEPKKPIEQMLEALAKARRAQFGSDPKMPNPMRTRLHEEIARGEAAKDENTESRPSWVTMFWPRLTVAAALATLLVLVPAIWWNQSHQVSGVGNVALRERTAGAGVALNTAASAEDTLAKAPAVSASEQKINLADNNKINVEPAKPSSELEASKSSTHFAEGRVATGLPSQATKGGFDKEIASANIQAAPAAAPAGGVRDSKDQSDRMAAQAPPAAQPSSATNPATMQQFSQQSAAQSFRNTAQVSPAPNVLNTFHVQQQGSDIRVVDADGSTYTGKIEQSAKSAELDSPVTARRDVAKQTQRYAAKSASGNESAAPQSYFRATGYNMSLKKTVVFEGNYAAPSTQQSAMAGSQDRERSQQSSSQARIVGTVRVNGEAPVHVDAIAEIPETSGTKKSEK
jgi:hypothetical protein